MGILNTSDQRKRKKHRQSLESIVVRTLVTVVSCGAIQILLSHLFVPSREQLAAIGKL